MQSLLTHAIEILVTAFVYFMIFDFVYGLLAVKPVPVPVFLLPTIADIQPQPFIEESEKRKEVVLPDPWLSDDAKAIAHRPIALTPKTEEKTQISKLLLLPPAKQQSTPVQQKRKSKKAAPAPAPAKRKPKKIA
jgi:hypothetical protein